MHVRNTNTLSEPSQMNPNCVLTPFRDEHSHDADEAHGTRAASHSGPRSSGRRGIVGTAEQ